MVNARYVEFAPSVRNGPAGAMTAAPADEPVAVSLYLKPRHHQGAATPEGLARQRAALHADDIAQVRAFAKAAGLEVTAVEPGRRLIRLSGTAAQMEAAFRTTLHHCREGARTYRARSGTLSLPQALHGIVEAVLGLDTRPVAQPRSIIRPAASTAASFLPNVVGALYNYPSGVTGAGQCIGLIELGGGYTDADTAAAFQAMGLPAPTVVAVPVDGGGNAPTPDSGADGEVALDIQVAGGVAPGARIAVYFAPNTDAGFVDAITAATHDASNKPSVLSISWGSAEANWTAQAMTAMTSALRDAAGLNISVLVAAGDNLATDGVSDGKAHVDFPASSPWAIGCGGTLIEVTGQQIVKETVWNEGTSGTGGGISDVYPVPDFQSAAGLPKSVNDGHAGRGVPDVAGDADPNSGYVVVLNGQQQVVGGTSAVAPLWAGLAALINEKAARPAGFFLPTLYDNASALKAITGGNNEPSGSSIGYRAAKGWSACTGLGVPDGQAVFDALTGAAAVG